MAGGFTTQTDGALLRRVDQDVLAFDEFYRRYEPIVVAFLMRRVRDAELAADLTAESFAAALRGAHRFRDDGQPAAGWMLGIARHTMLRHWERKGAERRALRRLGVERPELSDATLERIEAVADLEAAGNPLTAALLELPADQRDAIRAYVLDERPYAEIADELGIPAATVRQRVRRGLSRLRTLTEEPPR